MWVQIQLVMLYLLTCGCVDVYVGADPTSDIIPSNMWVCGCVSGVGMWVQIQLLMSYLCMWMCCRRGYVGADPTCDVIPANVLRSYAEVTGNYNGQGRTSYI